MKTAKEECAEIRKALRAKGFTGSVQLGRGTAYGWVHLKGSGEWGAFTDIERALLVSVGFTPGGNFSVISPESRRYWVLKLTDPTNPLIIIEQDKSTRAFLSSLDA